jgi:hypothetical protein
MDLKSSEAQHSVQWLKGGKSLFPAAMLLAHRVGICTSGGDTISTLQQILLHKGQEMDMWYTL